MAEFNAEVVCAKLHENVKSNQHRIEDLETQQNTIQEIVVSIRELALEMRGVKDGQEKMTKRLDVIEQKPLMTINTVKTAIISALIGGTISIALTKLL